MHLLIAVFFSSLAAAFAIWISARVISGRRPSRRFIFRIVCVIGALLGVWVGIAEYQYRRQMLAIGMVERLHGSVVATSNAPTWFLRLRPDDKIRAGSGIGPNGLRKLLPINRLVGYSLVVKQVWLDNANGFHPYSDFSGEKAKNWNSPETTPTANDLGQLNRFTQLQALFLQETAIGDAEIAAIRNLRSLKELWLTYTDVTDASMDIIAGFEELERLGLDGTKITDAGLSKLLNLKRLKELQVNSADITEDGLAPFRRIPGLKVNPHISN